MEIARVDLRGGELKRVNNYYNARVVPGQLAVLIVYLRLPDGTLISGDVFEYPIVQLKDPEPMVLGKKSGWMLHKFQLEKEGYMKAEIDRWKQKAVLPIVHYEMEVLEGEEVVNYPSDGPSFSLKMRQYVRSIQKETVIRFVNIKCRMPDGEIRNLANMDLFVDCAPEYKVLQQR